MKALSIRGPWWWFILRSGKSYENRDWTPQYARAQLARCPEGSYIQLHAGAGMTHKEFDEALTFAVERCGVTMLPNFGEVARKNGGIVGSAKFAQMVRASTDPWFTGPLALKLEDVYEEQWMAMPGQLGFFEGTGVITPRWEQAT